MTNRVEYYDILRGLAIIGVVIIHSSGLGLKFPDDSFNFHFTILWRNLWNFSVPLFLTLSGYFIVKKNITDFSEHIVFLKKQIPRVYIPMFIWSIIWVIIAILVLDKPIVKEFIKLIIFQASGPYYFIALIIQYYILLPFLKRFSNTKGLILSLIISLFMTSIIFYIRYFTDIKLLTIIYAGNFLTWNIFFIFGLYLGSKKRKLLSNQLLISLIVIFYILSCVETYLLYISFNQIDHAVTAVKASSFLFSLALIAYFFKNIDFISNKILKNIGEVSFGIYLVHMFIIIFISKVLLDYPFDIQNFQPIYQLIITIITISFAYLLIMISKKFISIKWIQFLGFK